ncbi:MAG: protein kinase [Myxococcota bacterium]|nr:protein kinase [Myxococcota bacterium]
MGIVVEATHLSLGTPVAIKVLRADAAEDPELLERFMREARSAARLRGEHVCRVQDFGTTEDGAPFMVMEYLEGEDLMSVVDRNGPLDPTQTATYILQACIGVAEAHALGIIHRDLKPGNLFVVNQPDGRRSIKLLDFGIAKSNANVDGRLTNTSKAMGSPAYMSPEQLRAAATVDARCDVWALGVTMFELLTEHRPFKGDTPYELAIAISTETPDPLPPSVPEELAKIVSRCLEKNLDRRYRDVAALAAALAPLVKHGKDLAAQVQAALVPETATDPVGIRKEPSPATLTTLRGASGTVDAGADLRPRSRWLLPLSIAAVVALAGGGVLWWSMQREPVAQPAQAPPQSDAPVPIDAAVDAAIDAAEPVDAMEADAAEQMVAPPPVDDDVTEKPTKKKRGKKRGKLPRTDLGSSRF